jgi:hypothetical protein
MDFEYEKVEQEYKAGKDVTSIRSMCPAFKYAGRTAKSRLLGVGLGCVFSLDLRQYGANKIAEYKQYKTNLKFCAHTSDTCGNVAVGSDDGEVRLYNTVSKVAKTHFVGFDSPVVGLDVTAVGKFVLLTTPQCLIVYATRVAGQKKSRFAQMLPMSSVQLIKLQLRMSDLQNYNLRQLNFTKATFSSDAKENSLVTSTDNVYVQMRTPKDSTDDQNEQQCSHAAIDQVSASKNACTPPNLLHFRLTHNF